MIKQYNICEYNKFSYNNLFNCKNLITLIYSTEKLVCRILIIRLY